MTKTKGRYLLRKAADPAKDQSYVLYNMTQNQLCSHHFSSRRAILSLRYARLPKSITLSMPIRGTVRIFASFPMVTMRPLSKNVRGRKFPPGNFIDENGKVLGRHKGIIHYTVGQRKGLGLALPQHHVCQSY